MRITDELVTRTLLNYVTDARDSAFAIQQQISSGKRVTKPSDDPSSYSLIRQLRELDARIQQYKKNADRVSTNLTLVDGKLQDVTDILHRVSELVVSGSDGTKTSSDRRDMGLEINQMLEEFVDLANAQNETEYLFAGLHGQSPAYSVVRDASGNITGVTYEGSQETRLFEIGQGVYAPDNIVGTNLTSTQGLFQSENVDIFANLINIRDKLLAGENLAAAEDVVADPATDTITVASIYATGNTVRFSSTDTLPTGLAADTDYYVISVSATQISLATSLANARAGVAIDFTDAGTGQLSLMAQPLTDVSRDLDHIMEAAAKIGAYHERVEFNLQILSAHELNIANDIEDEESVDVAKAVMELSNKKTAYEAALRSASIMLDQSLLNYI